MKAVKPEKTTPLQRAELLNRMKAYSHRRWRLLPPREKVPANVREAEKLIDKHNKAQAKRTKVFREGFDVELTEIREKLIFGDPDKALAAVKAFERKWKKLFD
jgi:predicted nuclease with TOPRIM domain